MSGTVMPGFCLISASAWSARVSPAAPAPCGGLRRASRVLSVRLPRGRPGPRLRRRAARRPARAARPFAGFTRRERVTRFEQGQILFVRRLQLLQPRLDLLALLG